ncbi:MAG: LysR family transcriptional regulator [Hungatella sp.]|nr:LysR family transcriptional regulator [Hungatella sp.]
MDARMETLLKVYETRNFTKAAKELSLTQPAVSQHIKQLEHDLDVVLFIRGEKGLKLTPEGEIVVKYARRIQTLYQNLSQSLEDEKRNVTRLSIGITHSSESSVIAEVLAGYTSVTPGSRITIISDTINNLYYKLKTYVLDIAIIEGRINDSNFNSVMLDTDSLILAVSKDNPLSQKQIVTLEELKKQKLILRLPNSATRNLFISHLESNNVSLEEFDVTLEVDNVATIKDLVRRNFGVSILPRSTFGSEMRKGKIAGLSIENLSMTREINMIYHKDFEHIDALQEITRIYREYSRRKRL